MARESQLEFGLNHSPADCTGPLGGSPVSRIADSIPLQTVLYRCSSCTALWECMERRAWRVTEATAEKDFPGVFGSGPESPDADGAAGKPR